LKFKIALDSISGTQVKGSVVHQQHLKVLNHLISAKVLTEDISNKNKQQHVRRMLRLQMN